MKQSGIGILACGGEGKNADDADEQDITQMIRKR